MNENGSYDFLNPIRNITIIKSEYVDKGYELYDENGNIVKDALLVNTINGSIYINQDKLADIIPEIKCITQGYTNVVYQDKPIYNLTNYKLGSNNYFVYACPKRLAFDTSGKCKISFNMPDLNSMPIDYDENTPQPIYTDGTFIIAYTVDQYKDIIGKDNFTDEKYKLYITRILSDFKDAGIIDEDTDYYTFYNDVQNLKYSDIDFNGQNFTKLDHCEMIYLGEFEFTNGSGYTETYVMWRSNGFFTHGYDNYEFNISIIDEETVAPAGDISRFSKSFRVVNTASPTGSEVNDNIVLIDTLFL